MVPLKSVLTKVSKEVSRNGSSAKRKSISNTLLASSHDIRTTRIGTGTGTPKLICFENCSGQQ
jgi:hypothetical protein